jgi:hypothetical protein
VNGRDSGKEEQCAPRFHGKSKQTASVSSS